MTPCLAFSPRSRAGFGELTAMLIAQGYALWVSVLRAVLRPIDDLKILWTIVRAVVVDVVDVFVPFQKPSEDALHDKAVLTSVAIVAHVNEDVAIAYESSWPSPSSAARMPEYEPPRLAMMDRRQLAAPTLTGLGLRMASARVATDILRVVVSAGLRIWQLGFTPTGAERRRCVAAQEIRRAVSEEMFIGDSFSASTGAVHRYSLTEMVKLFKERGNNNR